MIIKNALVMLIGFSAGIVISGAVFAFITVIGIVPRLAQKTGTQQYVMVYENAIIVGGIFGTLTGIIDLYIPIGIVGVILVSICIGIFFGCLAASLAEVLNVLPILTRRGKLLSGVFYFILALALGKLCGSLVYYCIPGFSGE